MAQGPAEEQHELLSQEDFMFHYENLEFAKDRNATYICYEVKKDELVDPSGHLKNKPLGDHAEIIFIRKMKALYPDLEKGAPDKGTNKYSITLFCSWSPCADCSSELVQFLKENPNLSLEIFVSRLYYSNEEGEREGLRKLKRPRMHIAVMRRTDFKYCWKTFVESNQRPFDQWDEIDSNSERFAQELHDILQLLSHEDFMFHYENLEFAQGRNAVYLCYVVKKDEHLDSLGYLKNEPDSNHAEIMFIREMKALYPDLENEAHGERIHTYSITWFCSWSPCAKCSSKLIQILEENPNLSLKIFISRLYRIDEKGNREGLRKLKGAGVHIAVMRKRDFKYCWKLLVESNQRPFEPWPELDSNSVRLARELHVILQVPAQNL